MTRKIFALLLALFLSLAACVAAAEETGGEYTVLGETGIRVRLAPGLEKQELTEEDIESGVIGYYTNLFAEGTEGKYVTVMYYPEEIITAEERLEECLADPFYTDPVLVTTEGNLTCVCFVLQDMRPFLKVAGISLGDKGYIEIVFEPYDSPEDMEAVNAMIHSLGKAE